MAKIRFEIEVERYQDTTEVKIRDALVGYFGYQFTVRPLQPKQEIDEIKECPTPDNYNFTASTLVYKLNEAIEAINKMSKP